MAGRRPCRAVSAHFATPSHQSRDTASHARRERRAARLTTLTACSTAKETSFAQTIGPRRPSHRNVGRAKCATTTASNRLARNSLSACDARKASLGCSAQIHATSHCGVQMAGQQGTHNLAASALSVRTTPTTAQSANCAQKERATTRTSASRVRTQLTMKQDCALQRHILARRSGLCSLWRWSWDVSLSFSF